MIYLGDDKIGRLYLGGTEIGKAYLGSDLVFQKGGPTPAPVFYDRLVFDGTAWILTNLVIPTDGSIRCTEGGETRKAQNLWYTDRGTGEGSIRLYWGGNTNSGRIQPMPLYRSTSYLFNNKNYSTSATERGVFQTCKGMGFDTTNYTYTKGNLPAPNPLYIGGMEGSSVDPFTGYLKTVYIYDDTTQNVTTYSGFDNYTPVYTLRPCLYGGKAGLWCVETSAFFGNSAESGTLTVSNDN